MSARRPVSSGVGGVRRCDGAKKLPGRKLHVLEDAQGLVLKDKVHTAALQDRAAGPLLAEGVPGYFLRLSHVWLDQGYTSSGRAWIEREPYWTVEVVQRPPT